MKKILISVGPIPAKVDSVKFITNVFKGGLALKTAEYLKNRGNDVTIIAWEHTKLNTQIPIIVIKDVMDYYQTILSLEFDAYILAGAVANLMPSNPYSGKFPSHNYSVGEKFQIEFEIAPRVIDEIKKKYPRSTLIGYKLFDGSQEDLIKAAKITLHESKANIVFANHPKSAKDKKIALTQDGSIFECSFDEHCDVMNRLIQETFYKTKEEKIDFMMNEDDNFVIENYSPKEEDARYYGTFAIRKKNGFLTTKRGKKDYRDVTFVSKVDHDKTTVYAVEKATLNAPLLDQVFKMNPHFNILIHGHVLEGKKVHEQYEFPGTKGDLSFACVMKNGEKILLNHHGFIVGFENIESFKRYQNEHKNK